MYKNRSPKCKILQENVKTKGVDKRGAALCYPAEIAHGLFQDLIKKDVDYIFLPHVKQVHVDKEDFYKKTCTILQGEPYYLRTAFKFDKLPNSSGMLPES